MWVAREEFMKHLATRVNLQLPSGMKLCEDLRGHYRLISCKTRISACITECFRNYSSLPCSSIESCQSTHIAEYLTSHLLAAQLHVGFIESAHTAIMLMVGSPHVEHVTMWASKQSHVLGCVAGEWNLEASGYGRMAIRQNWVRDYVGGQWDS